MTPDELYAEVLEFARHQVTTLERRLPALLASAREIGRAEEREACARLAERPYGDEVAAYAGDEPLAVGRKIAAVIRAREDVRAAKGEE
jgi:hypothetical protein